MRQTKALLQTALVGLLALVGLALAQTQGRMTIQATARGTSTQLGKMVDVNIYIEAYSTEDDRQTLINAFKQRRQDGLVDVLQDMKPKGRIRFANGGVGNDIKYIMELPSDNGRKLRLITDRWLSFAGLYNNTRSTDYNVGAIELNLTPDGKGSGTVLPACRLTVNKKKQQVEIETFQNPWELTNFMISKN
ncbi:MAG TPA: hypothetical protein VMP68_22475 [Candidatus Eisenbacteria bacterium]|nr:hypothetical protein [Candidatus Eisenbacteria bacterium]